MHSLQTIILLMFAAIILIGMAVKMRIPYPIALVIGGTALGFFPELQAVDFDPNLILIIVLPPILYYAAFAISFRDFKQNWRTIFSLALGLVFFSTLVIGLIFKWIFPEFPWALAFAFGAIVSPPDAAAATTILKRFSIGPHLQSILEGESLVNDATALVLYRMAVVALLTGTFPLFDASLEFLKIASGGILIGIVLGIILQEFSRRLLEPIVGVLFSFTIPYVIYITADKLGVSGVLAVVICGLIGSKILATHHSSQRRVIGFAVWDIFNILLNCFVFILIGLQLKKLTTILTTDQILLYTGHAAVMTAALIGVRMLWIYTNSGIDYIRALKAPNAGHICPQILREAAIIGWSSMRGIVSLAAALALPLTLSDGMPLEGRNEVIFMTFVVILLTLLIPGFTFAPLIEWLKIHPQAEHHGIIKVRKKLAQVANDTIHDLHTMSNINDDEQTFLTSYFTLQRRILEISISSKTELHSLEKARLMVIREQRKHLLAMWERLEIDDRLLRRLEHELDVEETHATRVQL